MSCRLLYSNRVGVNSVVRMLSVALQFVQFSVFVQRLAVLLYLVHACLNSLLFSASWPFARANGFCLVKSVIWPTTPTSSCLKFDLYYICILHLCVKAEHKA